MSKELIDAIRAMVMGGDSPYIRTLLLTDDQIILLGKVGIEGSLTSSDLARIYKISVQSAYARLNRLYQSGYLSMLERSAQSGGLERIYHPKEIF